MGDFENEVEKLVDADAPPSVVDKEEKSKQDEVWVLRTKMKPYRYAREDPEDKNRFTITYDIKKAKLFNSKVSCLSWAQKVFAVDNFVPQVVEI